MTSTHRKKRLKLAKLERARKMAYEAVYGSDSLLKCSQDNNEDEAGEHREVEVADAASDSPCACGGDIDPEIEAGSQGGLVEAKVESEVEVVDRAVEDSNESVEGVVMDREVEEDIEASKSNEVDCDLTHFFAALLLPQRTPEEEAELRAKFFGVWDFDFNGGLNFGDETEEVADCVSNAEGRVREYNLDEAVVDTEFNAEDENVVSEFNLDEAVVDTEFNLDDELKAENEFEVELQDEVNLENGFEIGDVEEIDVENGFEIGDVEEIDVENGFELGDEIDVENGFELEEEYDFNLDTEAIANMFRSEGEMNQEGEKEEMVTGSGLDTEGVVNRFNSEREKRQEAKGRLRDMIEAVEKPETKTNPKPSFSGEGKIKIEPLGFERIKQGIVKVFRRTNERRVPKQPPMLNILAKPRMVNRQGFGSSNGTSFEEPKREPRSLKDRCLPFNPFLFWKRAINQNRPVRKNPPQFRPLRVEVMSRRAKRREQRNKEQQVTAEQPKNLKNKCLPFNAFFFWRRPVCQNQPTVKKNEPKQKPSTVPSEVKEGFGLWNKVVSGASKLLDKVKPQPSVLPVQEQREAVETKVVEKPVVESPVVEETAASNKSAKEMRKVTKNWFKGIFTKKKGSKDSSLSPREEIKTAPAKEKIPMIRALYNKNKAKKGKDLRSDSFKKLDGIFCDLCNSLFLVKSRMKMVKLILEKAQKAKNSSRGYKGVGGEVGGYQCNVRMEREKKFEALIELLNSKVEKMRETMRLIINKMELTNIVIRVISLNIKKAVEVIEDYWPRWGPREYLEDILPKDKLIEKAMKMLDRMPVNLDKLTKMLSKKVDRYNKAIRILSQNDDIEMLCFLVIMELKEKKGDHKKIRDLPEVRRARQRFREQRRLQQEVIEEVDESESVLDEEEEAEKEQEEEERGEQQGEEGQEAEKAEEQEESPEEPKSPEPQSRDSEDVPQEDSLKQRVDSREIQPSTSEGSQSSPKSEELCLEIEEIGEEYKEYEEVSQGDVDAYNFTFRNGIEEVDGEGERRMPIEVIEDKSRWECKEMRDNPNYNPFYPDRETGMSIRRMESFTKAETPRFAIALPDKPAEDPDQEQQQMAIPLPDMGSEQLAIPLPDKPREEDDEAIFLPDKPPDENIQSPLPDISVQVDDHDDDDEGGTTLDRPPVEQGEEPLPDKALEEEKEEVPVDVGLRDKEHDAAPVEEDDEVPPEEHDEKPITVADVAIPEDDDDDDDEITVGDVDVQDEDEVTVPNVAIPDDEEEEEAIPVPDVVPEVVVPEEEKEKVHLDKATQVEMEEVETRVEAEELNIESQRDEQIVQPGNYIEEGTNSATRYYASCQYGGYYIRDDRPNHSEGMERRVYNPYCPEGPYYVDWEQYYPQELYQPGYGSNQGQPLYHQGYEPSYQTQAVNYNQEYCKYYGVPLLPQNNSYYTAVYYPRPNIGNENSRGEEQQEQPEDLEKREQPEDLEKREQPEDLEKREQPEEPDQPKMIPKKDERHVRWEDEVESDEEDDDEEFQSVGDGESTSTSCVSVQQGESQGAETTTNVQRQTPGVGGDGFGRLSSITEVIADTRFRTFYSKCSIYALIQYFQKAKEVPYSSRLRPGRKIKVNYKVIRNSLKRVNEIWEEFEESRHLFKSEMLFLEEALASSASSENVEGKIEDALDDIKWAWCHFHKNMRRLQEIEYHLTNVSIYLCELKKWPEKIRELLAEAKAHYRKNIWEIQSLVRRVSVKCGDHLDRIQGLRDLEVIENKTSVDIKVTKDIFEDEICRPKRFSAKGFEVLTKLLYIIANVDYGHYIDLYKDKEENEALLVRMMDDLKVLSETKLKEVGEMGEEVREYRDRLLEMSRSRKRVYNYKTVVENLNDFVERYVMYLFDLQDLEYKAYRFTKLSSKRDKWPINVVNEIAERKQYYFNKVDEISQLAVQVGALTMDFQTL